ncbi:movement protein [Sesamum angolense]|uniref:Movement protein n=1 Tax=Sesamum angolense TaxID=2727404 RepID=A0AAE1X0R0_9LAMI|nr:movement protein [Sesamum angolense]
MMVSNKTMERIMGQDSNLSPYDEFRIGEIGKVLNQIGLNQRKHHIIYKVSSGEFAIPMEFTGNMMEMQLIPKEEILEELSRLRGEIAVTMKWIHIGIIEIVIKATFKEGIDSEIHLLIMDRRINNLRDGCLGTIIEYIEIPRIFKEIAKVMAPDPIKIPRIGGVNMDKKKFAKVLLSFKQHGLIDSDSFYEESEEEIKNLKEALQELKAMEISKEIKLSRENVKRLIQRNFSENPLAWWDWNKIEATLKIKEECKDDSPSFLVRNHGEIKRGRPRFAIPQDEKELVVYIDTNDYRWAVVLIKRTTIGEEPCRYTGGLFTKQQAQVWHINEKEFFAIFLYEMEASKANFIMLRLRHLRENLEELNKKFGRLAVNAQMAGQIQRADLDTVQIAIRTIMVASTSLWNDLQELIRKVSSSEITNELREHGPKHASRVQGSKRVAANSSTACTRPSPDSGETATNESQRMQTSDDSSQSSAFGDYQRMWKKLISRKGVKPRKTIIEIYEKYNRVWILEGSKSKEVRECYEFGALASVHIMSPSFLEISKLAELISGAVYDSWQNNPNLKRGDILELKFISAALEIAGNGSHPTFH